MARPFHRPLVRRCCWRALAANAGVDLQQGPACHSTVAVSVGDGEDLETSTWPSLSMGHGHVRTTDVPCLTWMAFKHGGDAILRASLRARGVPAAVGYVLLWPLAR